MGAILKFIEKRPFIFGLAFSAIPYLGLRIYLAGFMHADAALATVPSSTLLASLVAGGAVLPAVFLVLVVRRLISERDEFQLRALLEVYAAVLLIFATTYAVLQTSSVEPTFAGMPTVWDSASAESAVTHLERLHAVFGNALYLSAVTMTTVGFGDITPTGFLAKALTALQGLLGISFVGLVLGQYFSSCVVCSHEKG